jgi:ABC-2 type transport system ATP-binding protein
MQGIEIKALSKFYGNTKAIDDVSINIDKPGVYLLAGPNGSGKTTLFETLVGLRQADSGSVKINGENIGTIQVKRHVGFLSQQNSLRKNCTVKEELELVKDIFNIELESFEYLKRFDLQDNYLKKTRHLSGGTKRRLLIAMLFMVRQNIVILDEPVSGLDTMSRDEIWSMISQYSKDNIVIISDHYLNQAALYSDFIFLINEGRIILQDTPENIVKSCKWSQLIKVRKEYLRDMEQMLRSLNKDFEVRISGTVCNLFTDEQHIEKIKQNKLIKCTVHIVDFEDVYFYHTGKYISLEDSIQ